MTRGTTPSFILKIEQVSLEMVEKVEITFAQNDTPLVIKTNNDIVISMTDNALDFTLSEEETLLFAPNKFVELQVRLATENRVIASDIKRIYVHDTLSSNILIIKEEPPTDKDEVETL